MNLSSWLLGGLAGLALSALLLVLSLFLGRQRFSQLHKIIEFLTRSFSQSFGQRLIGSVIGRIFGADEAYPGEAIPPVLKSKTKSARKDPSDGNTR